MRGIAPHDNSQNMCNVISRTGFPQGFLLWLARSHPISQTIEPIKVAVFQPNNVQTLSIQTLTKPRSFWKQSFFPGTKLRGPKWTGFI